MRLVGITTPISIPTAAVVPKFLGQGQENNVTFVYLKTNSTGSITYNKFATTLTNELNIAYNLYSTD